jgi:hypothetical protein
MVVAKWTWRISSGGVDPEKLEVCGCCDDINPVAASTCRWCRSGGGIDLSVVSLRTRRRGAAERRRQQRGGDIAMGHDFAMGHRFGSGSKQKETRSLVGSRGCRWDQREGAAEAAYAGRRADAQGRPRGRREKTTSKFFLHFILFRSTRKVPVRCYGQYL